ncbi:NAD-dependent epimerase/dehydratase family protein [Paenibacillus piri]|nr:NAD-dependent epimerase/dehydratase family protein [Paenibacillus piri]
MRAFVTGGTGLLGNNLVRALTEKGWQVKALARSLSKADRLLRSLDVELVEGDMMDVDSWANRLSGCDVLFHTAAYFRETFRNGDHWTNLEKVNVIRTVRLFELAKLHGIGKIIHTSTNATIRKREDGRISDESDLLNPHETLNLYGKSKAIGDLAIEALARKHRISVVTIMPAWMFGPGDAAPTGSGQLVLNFLNRKLPGYFPSGIDVVDARDVASAMIGAAETAPGGERYIVSAYHKSLEELFRIMEQVSGVKSPTRKYPLPMVYMSTWLNERIASLRQKETDLSVGELRVMTEMKRTSSAKALKELQISFRPFEDTIRDSVEWHRIHTMAGNEGLNV